jgi:hypothetical protein
MYLPGAGLPRLLSLITGCAAFSVVLTGCGGPTAGTAVVDIVETTNLDPVNFVYAQDPATANLAVQTQGGDRNPNFPDTTISGPWEPCMGKKIGAASAAATGPILTSADGSVTVSSNADITTPARLAARARELAEPRLAGCVEAALTNGGPPRTILTRHLPVPPGATARVAFSLSNAQHADYIDVVFVLAGRVEALVGVISLGKPEDSLAPAATAQLVNKIKNQ